MGMGMMVLPLRPRQYRGNGVRFYDGHRGNSGDENSSHGSTASEMTYTVSGGALNSTQSNTTELMVDALFTSKEHYQTFTDRQ